MFTLTEVWRDLHRNKGRSFLVFVFGILIIFCIAFYMGNIQNNEAILRNLSQTIGGAGNRSEAYGGPAFRGHQ